MGKVAADNTTSSKLAQQLTTGHRLGPGRPVVQCEVFTVCNYVPAQNSHGSDVATHDEGGPVVQERPDQYRVAAKALHPQ